MTADGRGQQGRIVIEGQLSLDRLVAVRDRVDAGGAVLSGDLGGLVAQPLAVLGQFPGAGGGGLQPAQPGG